MHDISVPKLTNCLESLLILVNEVCGIDLYFFCKIHLLYLRNVLQYYYWIYLCICFLTRQLLCLNIATI